MKALIEEAYQQPQLLEQAQYKQAVEEAIEALDKGELRVAEPSKDGWQINSWLKSAILLYFRITKMEVVEAGDLTFYDKIPLKKQHKDGGYRVVPHAIARYGSYIAPRCILMPGYVNIGAYVGEGTMVDTWATVGSCAQIGKDVHLSGGVGIGGVLEPIQAQPVIVEDGAFIGSRCIVVEGVRVGRGAVLGAGVTLTASSKIIDVRGDEPHISKGYVPENAVVIPGTIPQEFSAGTFQVGCALIIGERKASTDNKTSLTQVLREYNVAV